MGVMSDLGRGLGGLGSYLAPIPGLNGSEIGSAIGGLFGFKKGGKIRKSHKKSKSGKVGRPRKAGRPKGSAKHSKK